MSGLVNKIKDAVHGDKKHEQPTGTSGPHDSRTANAADPRVDSDRDHRANPATGTTGSTGTYGSSTTGGAGLGGDNFTQSGTGVTGVPGGHSNTLGSTGNTSSNRGPHDSNLANKADPRVDSDRDHRAAPGSTTGTSGLGSSNTAYGSTTGTTGTSGLGSSNRGPHDSNLANKADPRVDSDRDHRAGGIGSTSGAGGIGSTTGAGEYGSSHTTGAGEFGSAGRTTRSGAEYGSSNTAYGSTTGTTGTSGLGSSGVGNTSTNRGPHDSNLANKADPRVDSDRDHRAAPGSTGVTGNNYGTTGTTGSSGLTGNPGPAPNTAGPHKSDMLNKVDPRVDSDRDGSKTVGQDQTYARS